MLNKLAAIIFSLSSCFCLATQVSAPTETELNPVVMPKTRLEFIWMPSGQNLNAPAPLSRQATLKDTYGIAFGIDIPIWKYLAGGFYFQGLKGFNLKYPRPTDPDGLDNTLYLTLGLAGFLKPQVEIPVPYGHLALTLEVPLGVSVIVGSSRVDPSDLVMPPEMIAPFTGHIGWSFNTGAKLGVEYYPSYAFGLFIQGGYNGAYHLFPLDIQQMVSVRHNYNGGSYTTMEPEHVRMEYPGYWVYGFSVAGGVKWTY